MKDLPILARADDREKNAHAAALFDSVALGNPAGLSCSKRSSTTHTQRYVLAALAHHKGDVDVRDVKPDAVAKETSVLVALTSIELGVGVRKHARAAEHELTKLPAPPFAA